MQLEHWCQLMYTVYPTWPWKHTKDVPPECPYNMDKISSNPFKTQSQVLVSSSTTFSKLLQVFEVMPEGNDGRVYKHTSLAVTSVAGGRYKVPRDRVEGATPSMVVMADPSLADEGRTALSRMEELESMTENTKKHVNSSYFDGIININADTLNNDFGFHVTVTATRSMTKETFFEYCKSTLFATSLNTKDQGAKPSFYFLMVMPHVGHHLH